MDLPPALVVVAVLVVLIVFRLHTKASLENRFVFLLSDLIGLASFSITGSLIALEHHLNFTDVLALTFITAVGGGIARDVIINEVPFVFTTGFYGTIALIMGALMYLLDRLGLINGYALSLLLIVGTTSHGSVLQKMVNSPKESLGVFGLI